jgi:hypothetical protein
MTCNFLAFQLLVLYGTREANKHRPSPLVRHAAKGTAAVVTPQTSQRGVSVFVRVFDTRPSTSEKASGTVGIAEKPISELAVGRAPVRILWMAQRMQSLGVWTNSEIMLDEPGAERSPVCSLRGASMPFERRSFILSKSGRRTPSAPDR